MVRLQLFSKCLLVLGPRLTEQPPSPFSCPKTKRLSRSPPWLWWLWLGHGRHQPHSLPLAQGGNVIEPDANEVKCLLFPRGRTEGHIGEYRIPYRVDRKYLGTKLQLTTAMSPQKQCLVCVITSWYWSWHQERSAIRILRHTGNPHTLKVSLVADGGSYLGLPSVQIQEKIHMFVCIWVYIFIGNSTGNSKDTLLNF